MSDKRQTSKIFVGGLSWETTDQRLRTYFENYGAVSEAFVSFDRTTGRPRGFGFVVFEDAAVADKVVSIQHTIDRREVEAKKAVPKEDHPGGKQLNGSGSQRTKKIFVGGLAPSVDEQAFRKYFEQYGEVEDAVVMYDHDNKRPRGFGFVTFVREEGVDEVFTGGSLQNLHDKPIEIKRAVPRDQIASARGRPAFGPQANARMNGASGFAAAALGPAFGEGSSFPSSLLSSHSLGAPSTQTRIPHLSGAASMGGPGPGLSFPNDLALTDGFTVSLLNAMSNQLSGQLSIGSQAGGLTNLAPAAHMGDHLGRAGSAQLQNLGSSHLSVPRGQRSPVQGVGSSQATGLSLSQVPTSQLQHMGSSHLQHIAGPNLQSAGSGMLQGDYGLGNGISNGLSSSLSGNLGHADMLGSDFSSHAHIQHPYSQQASSKISGSAFSGGSAFANSSSSYVNGHGGGDLEKTFGSMSLDHQPSVGSELPPPLPMEERVNMLSAGSAGLGQLTTSPKLSPAFNIPSYQDVAGSADHPGPHDVTVGSRTW